MRYHSVHGTSDVFFPLFFLHILEGVALSRCGRQSTRQKKIKFFDSLSTMPPSSSPFPLRSSLLNANADGLSHDNQRSRSYTRQRFFFIRWWASSCCCCSQSCSCPSEFASTRPSRWQKCIFSNETSLDLLFSRCPDPETVCYFSTESLHIEHSIAARLPLTWNQGLLLVGLR